MAKANQGDTVKVHYTGTLKDGAVFDSSEGKDPLQFTLGKGEVIAGFEKAVLGMAVGETRTICLPPGEAYGDYRDDGLVTVERAALPRDVVPEVGQVYQLTMTGGGMITVSVAEVTEEGVTLDSNHPLAGKDLTFVITLQEVGAGS